MLQLSVQLQLRGIELRLGVLQFAAHWRNSGSTNIYKLAQSPKLVISRDCICMPSFFFFLTVLFSKPQHHVYLHVCQRPPQSFQTSGADSHSCSTSCYKEHQFFCCIKDSSTQKRVACCVTVVHDITSSA